MATSGARYPFPSTHPAPQNNAIAITGQAPHNSVVEACAVLGPSPQESFLSPEAEVLYDVAICMYIGSHHSCRRLILFVFLVVVAAADIWRALPSLLTVPSFLNDSSSSRVLQLLLCLGRRTRMGCRGPLWGSPHRSVDVVCFFHSQSLTATGIDGVALDTFIRSVVSRRTMQVVATMEGEAVWSEVQTPFFACRGSHAIEAIVCRQKEPWHKRFRFAVLHVNKQPNPGVFTNSFTPTALQPACCLGTRRDRHGLWAGDPLGSMCGVPRRFLDGGVGSGHQSLVCVVPSC